MYHNGFSAEEIQRRDRWVSDVWKVYIQWNSEGAEAMTRRMSTNSTMLHNAPRPAKGGVDGVKAFQRLGGTGPSLDGA